MKIGSSLFLLLCFWPSVIASPRDQLVLGRSLGITLSCYVSINYVSIHSVSLSNQCAPNNLSFWILPFFCNLLSSYECSTINSKYALLISRVILLIGLNKILWFSKLNWFGEYSPNKSPIYSLQFHAFIHPTSYGVDLVLLKTSSSSVEYRHDHERLNSTFFLSGILLTTALQLVLSPHTHKFHWIIQWIGSSSHPNSSTSRHFWQIH